MSYAIGTIIYGAPYTEKIRHWFTDNQESGETTPDEFYIEPNQWNRKECVDKMEELGFTTLYTANGDYAGYIGVELKQFDECEEVQLLSDLMVRPTLEQKSEVAKKLEILPQGLFNVLEKPDVYVVWSST